MKILRSVIGIAFVVTVVSMLMVSIACASVRVAEETKEVKRKVKDVDTLHTEKYYTVDTGKNVYVLKYTYYTDPVTGSYCAGSPGVSGIGMIGPDGPGWSSDFINVRFRGRDLGNKEPKITVLPGTDRGGVDFTWSMDEDKTVSIRFIGKDGDPFLYTRITASLKGATTPQPVELTLLAHPGSFGTPRERYLKTAVREGIPPQELVLEAGESWAAYMDKQWDSAKGKPSAVAGLVLDPGSVKESRISVGAYTVSTGIKAGSGEIRLALLEMKNIGNDDFVSYMSQNADQGLQSLAKADLFDIQTKVTIKPPTE